MVERVGRKHFYLDTLLKNGAVVALPKPFARRLSRVLRLKAGAELALFNGKDGVWCGVYDGEGIVTLKERLQEQVKPLGLTLYIGLLKKEAMDRVLRQATECGVEIIQPVLTEFTVPDKLNLERAEAIVVEAAEQCERGSVPMLQAPKPLQEALQGEQTWWCDEVEGGKWQHKTAINQSLLVGPEGGFSAEERAWLQKQSFVTVVGLGPNILRADTAVVAALSRYFEYL